MTTPLKLLANLRQYRGEDPKAYLETQHRQNLKAIEDALRRTAQPSNITQVLAAATPWIDTGEIILSAITTAPTKGNVSIDSLKYRLDGPDAILRLDYAQLAAGGASGSGDYLIDISAIGKIDLNVVPAHTGTGQPIAQCSSNVGYVNVTNNTTVLEGYGIVYSETQIRICGLYGATSTLFWGSATNGLGGDVYASGELRIPLKQT